MGAHSFGKASFSASGAVPHGPFCNFQELLKPALNEDNLRDCKPVYGKISKCWVEEECEGTWCNGDPDALAFTRYTPVWKDYLGNVQHGFVFTDSQGAIFDTTPESFDNDYFKLIADNDFILKDSCCGEVGKDDECTASGFMQNISSTVVDGGACAIEWCRSDGNSTQHMKSTRAWAEVHPDFVDIGTSPTQRVIRSAADWVLLGSSDTKAIVQKFAESEGDFFAAFAQAFEKVTRKSTVELKTCES